MLYLQAQQQQQTQPTVHQQSQHQIPQQAEAISSLNAQQAFTSGAAQAAFYSADHSPQQLTPVSVQPNGPSHSSSASFSIVNGSHSPVSMVNGSSGTTTIGGLLAPSNARGAQHSRAVSLPVFTQGPFAQGQQQTAIATQQQPPNPPAGFGGLSSGIGGFGGAAGYGLAISGDMNHGSLPGWAEEEIGAQ
jgi:hypothetical protein